MGGNKPFVFAPRRNSSSNSSSPATYSILASPRMRLTNLFASRAFSFARVLHRLWDLYSFFRRMYVCYFEKPLRDGRRKNSIRQELYKTFCDLFAIHVTARLCQYKKIFCEPNAYIRNSLALAFWIAGVIRSKPSRPFKTAILDRFLLKRSAGLRWLQSMLRRCPWRVCDDFLVSRETIRIANLKSLAATPWTWQNLGVVDFHQAFVLFVWRRHALSSQSICSVYMHGTLYGTYCYHGKVPYCWVHTHIVWYSTWYPRNFRCLVKFYIVP